MRAVRIACDSLQSSIAAKSCDVINTNFDFVQVSKEDCRCLLNAVRVSFAACCILGRLLHFREVKLQCRSNCLFMHSEFEPKGISIIIVYGELPKS